MIPGTSIAIIVIALVIGLSLRSFKYGLLSILPNVIPIIMGYGLWYLLIGRVGFAISMVGSVTLGIIVDDTIHFLAKYVKIKREEQKTPEEAILQTFQLVGPALFSTSVILVMGFSILMLSDFLMNWILGFFSAMVIIVALLVDFLFLPAILLFVDKWYTKTKSKLNKTPIKEAA